MQPITQSGTNKKSLQKLSGILVGLICIVIISGIYVRAQFTPPANFIDSIAFEVTPGMTVRDIADAAQAAGLVRSGIILYSILTYSHDPTGIYAGTYVFTDPASVMQVAQKLANKEIENDLVRITIPEGMPLVAISDIAAQTLPDFNAEVYVLETNGLEGYLFPETYFVPVTFTASDLITLQQRTYEENLEPLRTAIQTSALDEYEVLILASIVEREANDEESMKMVAGILLNRLAINMPLQADASIEYIIDMPLNELPPGQLAIELRETHSPYNTYLNRGLPPTPIGNPGIMAIEAVVFPTLSENFFYITDTEGIFHYAETFAEHTRNVDKYLR
jgi:UPF0755 protein